MILLIISTVLNFYTNDVEIKRGDSTFIPYFGMEIEEKDTIIVKDSSKAEILYSDSSSLLIDENSRITTTSGKNRNIFLSIGRVWAKVKSLLRGQSFEINSPISVSGIRGTEFTVSYKEDKSEVKVISGKVKIREFLTGSEALLERERMALIKRGLPLKIQKFKIEELERWNRWKEKHLKDIIRRIEIALERGNIMRSSLLIKQGYTLARRLNLTEEYRAEIGELKKRYEKIQKKQGLIDKQLQDIRYGLRMKNPLLIKIEPLVIDLREMVGELSKQRKELVEYISEHKKFEAMQILSVAKILMKQIDTRIKTIPTRTLDRVVAEAEKDYRIVKEIESEKYLNMEIKDRAKEALKLTKARKVRVKKLQHQIKRTIADYNRIKEDIYRLKREINR